MSQSTGIHVHRPTWQWLAAGGLILASFVLRAWHVNESLWLDELHTAWCAAGTFSDVAPRAAIGNQSPVFFWLEWMLVSILGPSELVLRLPSLLAGSLLPLAILLLARRWSTIGVGLVAAAILAVEPLAIFYSTEARPYALVQLLAVFHMAITAELLVQPMRWRRAAWVTLAAILFHLHYTAALLFVAEAVIYAIFLVAKPRELTYRWISFALDTSLLGFLCLPAFANIDQIFDRRANWAAFVDQEPLTEIFVWWPAALGGWFVMAAVATRTFSSGKEKRPFALHALSWLTVPPIVAWLATQWDIARLFFPRYLAAVQPAAALLGAWCLDLAPWRWSQWLMGCLLVGVMIWSSGVVESVRSGNRGVTSRGEDWRAAVRWLNEQLVNRPLPVLVASGMIEARELHQPHSELLEDYLLSPVTSLYPLDVDRLEMAPLSHHEVGHVNQIVEMLILHRGGAWLIVRGKETTALHLTRELKNAISQSAVANSTVWRFEVAWSGAGVQIVLLQADQP